MGLHLEFNLWFHHLNRITCIHVDMNFAWWIIHWLIESVSRNWMIFHWCLQNLGQIQVLCLPDLVFSRSVDGDVVVNDGILMTWRVHSQHDSLFLLKLKHWKTSLGSRNNQCQCFIKWLHLLSRHIQSHPHHSNNQTSHFQAALFLHIHTTSSLVCFSLTFGQ